MYDPENLANTLGRKDWDNLVTSFQSALDKAYQAGRRDALKEGRNSADENQLKELLMEYTLAVIGQEQAKASLSRAKSQYSQSTFRQSVQDHRESARQTVEKIVDQFVGPR